MNTPQTPHLLPTRVSLRKRLGPSMLLGLLGSLLFSACGSDHPPLEVVDSVELYRYTGTWYEIERLPNRFERNLKCVTATYTLDEKDPSKIRVRNRGINTAKDDKVEDIQGTARVPRANEPAKLKVTFFWPFAGDYHILALDPTEGEAPYRYALVGDPSRKFLWILARNPELDSETVAELKAIARERGFDPDAMEAIAQDCQ